MQCIVPCAAASRGILYFWSLSALVTGIGTLAMSSTSLLSVPLGRAHRRPAQADVVRKVRLVRHLGELPGAVRARQGPVRAALQAVTPAPKNKIK
eukprot:1060825-Pyramimonas_sp.AAC.2